jgi:hypothetical protein
MKCSYHQERDAIAACSECARFLCAECALPTKDGKTLCSRCIALSSAREALRGLDQRLEQKEVRKSQEEERKRRREKLWVFAQWGMILVCLTVLALQVPRATSGFKEDKPIRKGTYATDEPTDRCIANLWRAAKVLQEGKTPGPELVCPESGKPYAVGTVGEDPTVRCPNPERHRVKEIRASRKRPVPEVVP